MIDAFFEADGCIVTKAGNFRYVQNKKGFVNDPTNPLLPTGQSSASTLNTDVGNPAHLGGTNNYGLPTDPLTVDLFNVPDSNGTPTPGSGTDSGAKPIIDPRKAVATINKKPCVDMCSPIHVPPTPTTPVNQPPQQTTVCYGGTILNPDNDNPGIKIVSASGHGKRRWTSDYSGYYTLNGSHAGFKNQVGATRGGLTGSALAGIMIWSDNGSTQRFNIQMKFSKAGTFYAHVFNAGRQGYNDRTYVNISGAADGNGRQNSTFSGKTFSFNGGGVKEFTVTEGQTVTFTGVCKGGGNHWHGLCMHISASSSGLDSCGKSTLASVPTTGGYANQPTKSYTVGNATVTYHEQHNKTARQTDNHYFTLTNTGQIECLFDMYSGGDKIEIYQGVSKGGESKLLVSTAQRTAVKLTDNEKHDILSKGSGQKATNTGHAQSHGNIRDFSYSGENVRYGGKLSVGADISNGTYIKVKITKPSIVYRFVMKMPNQPKAPIDPKQNPNPAQPCNVAIYSPTAPTPSTGTSTPVYVPGGQPVTQKKKKQPNHGAGGVGYSGGGGGGYYQSYGNQGYHMYTGKGARGKYNTGDARSYQVMANYGGSGLAPMAGFSLIPSIFKKTVKTTMSNSYGKYQPLTGSQFVNNTVQRVTGGQILPLAQPLRNVAPSKPGRLRALDLDNYPFWNELTYTGDNFYKKGNDFFTYTPGKIDSDIRLQDGTLIRNVLDDFNISDGISGVDVVLNYPGQLPTVLPNPIYRPMPMDPPYTIPSEDAPYDPDITWSETPTIQITPKIKDKTLYFIKI